MSDKAIITNAPTPQGAGRSTYIRKLFQTAKIGFFYLIVLAFFSFASTYSNARPPRRSKTNGHATAICMHV